MLFMVVHAHTSQITTFLVVMLTESSMTIIVASVTDDYIWYTHLGYVAILLCKSYQRPFSKHTHAEPVSHTHVDSSNAHRYDLFVALLAAGRVRLGDSDTRM